MLKKFLSGIYKVDEDTLEEYISYWTEYELPKNTLITVPGEAEPYLYYVIEGVQKAYFLDEKHERILFFSYAPSFSGIMDSFLTQTPSKLYLETISSSQFLRIPFARHNELIQKHRQLETLFRIFVESTLVGLIERHYQLMSFNIENRFKQFAQRSPQLIQLLPQKDIAAYLRIDPTNFSKLMNTVKF